MSASSISSFSARKVLAAIILIIAGSAVVCGFAFVTGIRLTPVVEGDVIDSQLAGEPYSNIAYGFKLRVPDDFTANESHTYYALGPDKEITGVSFRVPTHLATETNLVADSYMSVERIGRAECRPADFLASGYGANSFSKSQIRELGQNQYLYATGSDAGAGNLYEEHIYTMKHNGMCFGVRFFIHSTRIANYDSGTIREFDRDGLLARFRHITATIRFI